MRFRHNSDHFYIQSLEDRLQNEVDDLVALVVRYQVALAQSRIETRRAEAEVRSCQRKILKLRTSYRQVL